MPPKPPPQSRWGFRSIADHLTHQIRTGQLQPGQALPTREELAKHYGVSATTVYRALSLLVERQLTEGHQGKAVYVAGGEQPEAPAGA